ncbi:MAG: sulfotransferase, partial [Desulfotignum sp.]|nr:sulfotransferase [Desulfotignum sp.]
MNNRQFSPIFIVGAPRSGTTLLAVMLDRHPQIAIPPETQFFTEFLPWARQQTDLETREKKIHAALAHPRLQDTGLEYDTVFSIFKVHDNTFKGLFRSLLEAYAKYKNAERPGEKSPKHLVHVPDILRYFPQAKIICLVRDGRDVVLSLLMVAWAEPGNPRRFGLFCSEWNASARMAQTYLKTLPASRFYLVKYEDILRRPEKTLHEICEFIGEPYLPEMLRPGNNAGAIPEWEMGWKENAANELDLKRVQAWQRCSDPRVIWR